MPGHAHHLKVFISHTREFSEYPEGGSYVDAALDAGHEGVMVKAVDLEAASAAIAPAVGSETLIVCCQNGVRAPDVLGAAFGADKVAPMAVYMPAYIAAPGHIRHPASFDGLVIGALEAAAAAPDADYVMAAIVGAAGLLPTLAAVALPCALVALPLAWAQIRRCSYGRVSEFYLSIYVGSG